MENGPLRLMIGTDDAARENGMAEKLQARGFEVQTATGAGEILERVREGAFDFLVLPTAPLQAGMFLLAEQLQEDFPGLSGRVFFLPEVPPEAEDQVVGNLAGLMKMFSRLTLKPSGSGKRNDEMPSEDYF